MRIQSILPCCLSWLLAAQLPLGAQQGQVATLTGFSDTTNVNLSLRGQPVIPVKRKMPLRAGYVMQTVARGQADVLFTDGKEVKVDYNTTVEFSATNRNHIQIARGRVRPRVPVGTELFVHGPYASAHTFHTDLQVEVADDGTTTLTVIEGDVEFSNPLGRVVVKDGFRSTARRGQPPTRPEPAADLPRIIQWSNDVQPVALVLETVFVSQDPARLDAALREAERLPAGPEQPRQLGDIWHDRGTFDIRRYPTGLTEALRQYDAALQALAPAQPGAPGPADANRERARLHARIGHTWLEIGNAEKAEAAFQESLKLAPDETTARVGRVLALLTRREQDEVALAQAQAAVERDPGSPAAHTVRALAIIRWGERDPEWRARAQQELATAVKIDPAYAQAYAWQSFLYRTAERLDDASSAARQAVHYGPFSSLAAQAHSDTAFTQRDYRTARAEAARAVRLDSLSPGARVSLGRVLLQQGELDRAAPEAAKAVALGPNLDRAHFLLGLVLWEQRRLPRAEREFQQALRLDPGYLEASAYLARVYVEEGNRQKAEEVARDARRQNLDFAPVRAALGRVDYRAGLLKPAREEFREALRLQPDSPAYRLELARVYLDQNDLPGALAEALQAVHQLPASHEAHAVLGLVYDRQENREQAQREYQEALSLFPDDSLARLGLVTAFTPASFGFFESGQERLRERAQALLREPSVLQELFVPGRTAETGGELGSQPNEAERLLHRGQLALGRVHDLSMATRFSDGGDRKNADDHGRELQSDVAIEATPKTQVLLQVLEQRLNRGLSGPVQPSRQPAAQGVLQLMRGPDPDARAHSRRIDFNLNARYHLGRKTELWLGHDIRRIRDSRKDPDGAPEFAANGARNGRVSELRLDHTAGAHRFSLGFADLGQNIRLLRSIGLAPGSFDQEITERDFLNDFLQYLQDDYRIGAHGALIIGAQLLRTRDRSRQHSRFPPGSNLLPMPPPPPGEERHRDLLPYLALTDQLDGRNLLRFVGYKTRTRFGGSLLTPSEAFIVSEPINLQFGGKLETFELDYEHRFSARTFTKLFAQHSLARLLNVQPMVDQSFEPRSLTIPKVEERILGARLEQQITPYLSSFTRLEYVRAADRSPHPYTINENGFLSISSGPNPSRGLQVPFSPRWQAQVGFNYVDGSGTKLRLVAIYSSRQYTDVVVGSADQFGGTGFNRRIRRASIGPRTVFDLRIAKEPSLNLEYGLTVTNLFNTATLDWPGFPKRGRLWLFSIARRY